MSPLDWVLANGDKLQFGLFVGLGSLLALWEGRSTALRSAADRSGRWPANLSLTLLNVLALGLLPISLLSAGLWAAERGIGLLHAVEMPEALAFGATLLARSLASWYTHLAMHLAPWLWRVHRVHHLDTQLDVSTTVRFHPAESGIGLALGLPAVLAFGLMPSALAVYELLDVAVTLLSHAAIRLPPGLERILRVMVVTPGLHRVHHSSYRPETNSNYGAVFPLWDMVFGTYRTMPADLQQARRLGLEAVRDARTNNLHWLLVSPWTDYPHAPGTGERAPASPSRSNG